MYFTLDRIFKIFDYIHIVSYRMKHTFTMPLFATDEITCMKEWFILLKQIANVTNNMNGDTYTVYR